MELGYKYSHGYHKDIRNVCKVRTECGLSCHNCAYEGRPCEQYKIRHNVDRPYIIYKEDNDNGNKQG